MTNKLFYNTVGTRLLSTLQFLMKSDEFSMFRLVGGTSLSLQLGHRESVDIDLFTDAMYDTVDFKVLDKFLKQNFKYVDSFSTDLIGMGKTYYVGDAANECIKLDLYYTDAFIQPLKVIDGLRLASIEEIVAMKIEVVARKGRKKDFWDIHELIDEIPIQKMLDLHFQRYPYSHDKEGIIANFIDFSKADTENNPNCLRGKYWEVIKLDFVEKVKAYTEQMK